jgi:hypothetical protein
MSVRGAAAGGALGLGGAVSGHGPTWVVATVILVMLAGALGAAELGATAPLTRLVRLLRRLR